jgi:hypothetical protein
MIRGRLAARPPTLYLIIPGLLQRVPEWAASYVPFPNFPRLQRLLARSRRAAAPARGYDALLCNLGGLERASGTDLPLGALTRYGLTAHPHPDYCLAADPVHLYADLHRLILWGPDRLDLTQGEVQAFEALFNEYFQGRGVALEATSTAHWHLHIQGHQAVQTTPLSEVRGADIDAHLPRGEDAGFWRGLLNEVQMLFHETSVNRERTAQGRPAINSLWFYGAGALPEPAPTAWSRVWADDPLALGLARRAGVPTAPPPGGLGEFLAGAEGGSMHVVCLQDLAAASAYDEFPLWEQRMQGLESAWFGPLLQALRQGRLGRCHLHDCWGRDFRIQGGWWRRPWRRPMPLQAYAV